MVTLKCFFNLICNISVEYDMGWNCRQC